MDPPLKEWARTHGVVAIEYHTEYPYFGDPFFTQAVGEQRARESYYGIIRVPSVRIDGTSDPGENSLAAYDVALSARRATPAPATITLVGSYDAAGGLGHVTATVRPEVALPPRTRLRLVLTESAIPEQAPNGVFPQDNIFRSFIPTQNGALLDNTIAGVPVEVARTFTIRPEWNLANLDIVCLLQDDATTEILQSATIDLDAFTPVRASTWGQLKARYR